MAFMRWSLRKSWSLIAAALPFATGCSNSTPAASSKICASDEAIACVMDSGCRGYKHCNTDGSGYGPCDCSLSNGATAQAGAASIQARTGGGSANNGTGTGGSTTGTFGGGPSTISQPSSGGSGTGSWDSGNAGQGGVSTGGASSAGASTAGAPTAGASTGPLTFRRAKRCDANGNCKCISLASFGAGASKAYGTGSDGMPSSTTDFGTWLADKTNATVTMVTEKPDLTAEYLANFDVILLQDLRTWTLQPAELQNLASWVQGGGGLIALSGYNNLDDDDVTVSNQALAFSGMAYNGGALTESVPGGECPASSRQLCPQAKVECCYCWNNVIPIQELNTDHPVNRGVNAIGAYYGRSINAGDATVLATYSPGGTTTPKVVAAAKPVGMGHVLLWGDEWITYTSQWSGGQVERSLSADQLRFAPCYDSSNQHWLTADHVFQTKQFWYNLIAHVAPPTECWFAVQEPEVKITP